MEDKNGDIWVGTLRGIYRFDTDKEKFIRLDAISEEGNSVEEKVTDIAQGKNGDIWIADYSKGVFKYEVSNNKLICYSRENGKINSNEVLSLCCDLDSTLWAGSIGFNKSGLSRYDELSDSFITYEHLFKGGVSKISESSTNNLFVCSPINGLCSFNRITERSEPLFFIKGKEQTITDVLEEKDNLWIGTTDGLYIKNKTTGKISHFESSSIRDNSLTSNDITNILMDHNGGLWFSTLSKGINYLPDNWSDFEFYPSSEETASHGQIKHFRRLREISGSCRQRYLCRQKTAFQHLWKDSLIGGHAGQSRQPYLGRYIIGLIKLTSRLKAFSSCVCPLPTACGNNIVSL